MCDTHNESVITNIIIIFRIIATPGQLLYVLVEMNPKLLILL